MDTKGNLKRIYWSEREGDRRRGRNLHFFIKFVYFVCVCVCSHIRVCMCMPWQACRGLRMTWRNWFSSIMWVSRIKPRLFRLGSRHFDLLSHFAGLESYSSNKAKIRILDRQSRHKWKDNEVGAQRLCSLLLLKEFKICLSPGMTLDLGPENSVPPFWTS